MTLGLGVMGWSPTLGVEMTKRNNKLKKPHSLRFGFQEKSWELSEIQKSNILTDMLFLFYLIKL